MKIFDLFHTPFPNPQGTKKNILWVVLVGLGASIFILLYEPFGIANTTNEWYVDLIIFSLGILFILSILFIEFWVPRLFPKPFERWTLGKALIWYPLVIVFVGGIQFLYKSYLGNWQDFTWLEFLFVLARMLGIGFTVAFFVLGIWQFFNPRKISRITSKENYTLKTADGKSIQINLQSILYIASDDNYVDIHYESDGIRKKQVLRSSLKNIESQITNPLSPILRCHRKYLINSEYFEIISDSNRKMTIGLKNYDDSLPVSSQFIPVMRAQLSIRP
ncbi:MAG: LytTR family transcriptional regulator DNA-binding domain-containing protein [Bacteroidia bacterium]|nr:LytTR family transcriptional regulator DNA-binding domain-containing protein [Bacteroidia bacterium]